MTIKPSDERWSFCEQANGFAIIGFNSVVVRESADGGKPKKLDSVASERRPSSVGASPSEAGAPPSRGRALEQRAQPESPAVDERPCLLGWASF